MMVLLIVLLAVNGVSVFVSDTQPSKALCRQSCRAATNALMSSTIILPLDTLSSLYLLKESDSIIRQLSRLCQSVSRLPDT